MKSCDACLTTARVMVVAVTYPAGPSTYRVLCPRCIERALARSAVVRSVA